VTGLEGFRPFAFQFKGTWPRAAQQRQIKEGQPHALGKHLLGFDTERVARNGAAQTAWLLHVEDFQELQMQVKKSLEAGWAMAAEPEGASGPRRAGR